MRHESVRTRTCNFFSKIPETQAKKRFQGLVKHYVINLEFLNSQFCWTKFPTRAR